MGSKATSIIKTIFSVLDELVYTTEVAFSRDSLSRKMMRTAAGYRQWEINKSLKRLAKHGFLNECGNGFEVTRKGRERIDYYKLQNLSFDPDKKPWDHQWRIIVFDIPEKKRHIRKLFRDKVKEWNCTKLQQSVFITPHPCDAELGQLIRVLHARPYVHVILTPTLGPLLTERFEKKYQLH